MTIRAEHLTMAPVNEQAVPLPVRIGVLENMGNEALAYVTMGGSRLVARLSPTDALSLAVGQSAALFLNTVQAHFSMMPPN